VKGALLSFTVALLLAADSHYITYLSALQFNIIFQGNLYSYLTARLHPGRIRLLCPGSTTQLQIRLSSSAVVNTTATSTLLPTADHEGFRCTSPSWRAADCPQQPQDSSPAIISVCAAFRIFALHLLNHIKLPIMGKGDRKSTKGKRWRNSYGNARPKPGKEKKQKEQDKKGDK